MLSIVMVVTEQQIDNIADRLFNFPGVILVSERAASAIAERVAEKTVSDDELWQIAKASDYFIDFEDGEFAID